MSEQQNRKRSPNSPYGCEMNQKKETRSEEEEKAQLWEKRKALVVLWCNICFYYVMTTLAEIAGNGGRAEREEKFLKNA